MSGFPTGEQVYDRLKWDERFDLDRISIVFSIRPSGTKVVPYREFDLTTIPWHRIVEYRLDGEVLWSRADRIDRLTALAEKSGFLRSAGGGDVERVEPAPLETSPLTPARFDGGAWTAERRASPRGEESRVAPPRGSNAGTIRVATWNVLFDRFDADLLDSDRRWSLLLEELRSSNADLIALQEVTPGFLRRLLETPWIRASYAIGDATGSSVDPHGQVLLSRLPIREASVTRLAPHRRLLWARVDAGGLDLGVAVVHLASDRATTGAETRADELRAVAGHVRATPRGAWLVLGDFNSVEEENASVLRGLDAADAWRSVSQEPGLTFDIERNSIAGALSSRRRSGRFDRILSIAGSRAKGRALSAALLGTAPSAGTFPSDHFGVVAELSYDRAEGTGLDAAPESKRAALVLLPPPDLWGPVQRLRAVYDRGYGRWPPHVTMLWPFLDPAWLDEAGARLDELVSRRKPFEIAFDKSSRLEQSGETTLVLEPSGVGRASLLSLRGEALALFPQLLSEREFRPHLTIARVQKGSRDAAIAADIEKAGASMRWTADRLVLLARGEEGPLSIVHESLFAGAKPRSRRVSSAPRDVLATVTDHASRVAGRPLTVEPFGSTRYAPSLASDLDLLVIAGRRDDGASFTASLASSLVSELAATRDPPANSASGRLPGERVDRRSVDEPAGNQVDPANLNSGRLPNESDDRGPVDEPAGNQDGRANLNSGGLAAAGKRVMDRREEPRPESAEPGNGAGLRGEALSGGASFGGAGASWRGPGGRLRAVPGEGVAALRGDLGGRSVDLSIVFVDSIEAADDRNLPEGARRALLGARDADVLVERLERHGRYDTFIALLPMVKRWADARAIRSNAFGYTSSFGWALLLAPPLLHDEKLCALDAARALPAWFEWLNALPDGVDMTLDPVLEVEAGKRLRVRSPAAPFRNAGRSFTGSTEAVLRAEFALAARRTRGLTTSADALERAAIPLESDLPKGTLVEIRGPLDAQGAYEGAFMGHLIALEKAFGDRVRPWGRVSHEGARFVHRMAIEGPSLDEIRSVLAPRLAPELTLS